MHRFVRRCPDRPGMAFNLTVTVLIVFVGDRDGDVPDLAAPSCALSRCRPHNDRHALRKTAWNAVFRRFQRLSGWGCYLPADTLEPRKTAVMASTGRTDTHARYISIRTSSIEVLRRRYRSMMAVSNRIPFIELNLNSAERALILGQSVQTNERYYTHSDKRRLEGIRERLCRQQ